ncbi:uncharacterized protein [Maniola hyperantus]|uniref:uncharacterized protein n=1 Tax=Aphantopus hyperantus TaxID=2795564 RepID=UPI003748D946
MPRRSRCVFGCEQFDVLHHFPKPGHSSLKRFQQWKEIVGQDLESKTDDEIYTNYRICNHHFEDRFLYHHSKRLAKTAFPSLNLGAIDSSLDANTINQPESSTHNQSVAQSTPSVVHNIQAGYSQTQIQKKIITRKAGQRHVNLKVQKLLRKIVNLKNKLFEQRNQVKIAKKNVKNKII